jgi:hypothetical protein
LNAAIGAHSTFAFGSEAKKVKKKRADEKKEAKNPFTKSKKKDFSVIRTACKLVAGRQRKESLKVFSPRSKKK